MSPIAVIGEAVADTFPLPGERGTLRLEVRPGGSPVNAAVALGRLGGQVRYFGRLAAGPLGDLIRDHLTASRVDLGGSVTATEPATLAIASLDVDGVATYEFYADGTADWQWTREELAPERLAGAGCVHTGSMALVREPGGPVIEELLDRVRAHTTISIDPNIRPGFAATEDYLSRLGRWTGLADIFRLSDEDLGHLGLDFEQACARWHANGTALVIVTLGQDGALASLRGSRVRVPAPAVTVADTVGAGDAFTAGLLHRLDTAGRLGGRLDALTVDDLETAMAFAAEVAARTCAVPGADPPWAADLAAL